MSAVTLSILCTCFIVIINAANNCTVQQNVDYYQPGNPSQPCDTVQDCCNMCFQRDNCFYWTLYDGLCYFKQTNQGQQASDGRISGHCLGKNAGHQEWLVNISDSSTNPLYYWWDKCVGSGHGALLLRQDWRNWMKNAHDKINFTQVRCHGILDDDIGVVNGINDYSFVNIDNIYSYLLSIDMKPYIEISFMPEKFATAPNACHDHYCGIASPPTSYELWYDFIAEWVQHLVDYFGINEVRLWKFEVWNEPNLSDWTGGYKGYVTLYNATATAIKSVDKSLSVGGPTTAGFAWLDEFLNDILSANIPIDFVVTHSYPNQLGLTSINTWINAIQTQGIDVVNRYNNKYNLDLPLVISEFNSGCCRQGIDNGKFPNNDNYYAAAFMIFWAKHLQVLFADGNVDKSTLKWMSYWAISDVFEENGFDSLEFNDYYGISTIRGIPKPAFRAFQLLHEYGSEIEYKSSLIADDNGFGNVNMSTLQVYALKNAVNMDRYSIFIVNWNNYGFSITEQNVVINVGNTINNKGNNLKSVIMYRIDENINNTNPLATWIQMGSPRYPTSEQLQSINESSQLKPMQISFKEIDSETIQFELDVSPYNSIVLDLQY
eukprot:55061_1